MNNSAHKKITTLLLALCLLVTSAYAACMVCDSSPFTSEFSLDGSCAQSGFETSGETDDCCKEDSCTDSKPDIRALSRRNASTKAPGLAAIGTAAYNFTSQSRYSSLTRADYSTSLPPDRTYLQHCSFLC